MDMPIHPVGSHVRWVPLPGCLQFLHNKLPVCAPQLTSITLARDQCWASTRGLFPVCDGWVWELLGFAGDQICVRLWRADLGWAQHRVRSGARVRLATPSHGAATNRWVLLSEVVCGEGWGNLGEMYKVMLGPDVSNRGICREVVSATCNTIQIGNGNPLALNHP